VSAFSPFEFEEDYVVFRSWDPGDIARVLRLLNVEFPSSLRRPSEVRVTIIRDPLTEEICNAKINEDAGDDQSDFFR